MATVPKPAAFSAGENLTAGRMNELRESTLWGIGSKPLCAVWANDGQSMAHQTNYNLSWDGEDIDTDNMFNSAVSPREIYINTPGVYRLTSSVIWVSGAVGMRNMYVMVNGSAKSRVSTCAVSSNQALGMNDSFYQPLAAGDKIMVMVNHSQQAALGIAGGTARAARLSAEWVSA